MIEIIPNWHPIFVHFTVGLLLSTVAFHVAAVITGSDPLKQTLSSVANWTLWAGTVITIATVAAGWIAFNTVNHDTPSHHVMLEHRNLAMMTLATFIAVALWSWFRAKKNAPIQWPVVIAVCIAGVLLISTAWHGGELVYRHGLGVMSLPKQEAHTHGEGVAHDHAPPGETHKPADEHDHEHDTHQESDAETSAPSPDSEQTSPSQSDHTHEPGQENHTH